MPETVATTVPAPVIEKWQSLLAVAVQGSPVALAVPAVNASEPEPSTQPVYEPVASEAVVWVAGESEFKRLLVEAPSTSDFERETD